jgi:hypothetical protein
LALRYYVNTSGRTITLHTENNHLCQVITTFTTGLTALNGLTSQVQFFAVGTSGTDFAISSATDTHTFNLPTASATNRGALSSADWTTFNNKTSNLGTVTSVGLSSATSGVTIGSTPITTSGTITLAIATASGSQNGLLSSTDWSTFNSKQNALTNPVTGTGTTNYLPKFTGSTTIGNSVIQDTGTTVTISSNLVAINGNGITEFKINNNTSEWEFYMPAGSTDLRLYRGSDKVTFFANGNLLVGTGSDAGYKLDVNGTGRFSGALTLTASANRINSGNELRFYRVDNAIYTQLYDGGNANGFVLDNRNGDGFSFQSVGTNQLRIASTGAATFSSTLTSTDHTIKNSANAETLDLFLSPSTLNGFIDYPSGRSLTIRNKGSLSTFTLASTGAATFSSSITSSSGDFFATDGTRTNFFGVGTSANVGYLGTTTNHSLAFLTNNTEKMRITTSGDVYLNNAAALFFGPTSVTYVTASTTNISFAVNTGVRLTIGSTGVVTIANLGTGTVTATAGVLSTVSDSSYKIGDGFIDSAIEKVLSLKPRYFYWNDKSGLPMDVRQLGFYAQEVNEALGEEAANKPQNKNTPWGISDRSIIAMLTKAIQELKQEIETLKN